jgi:hypothetical protein
MISCNFFTHDPTRELIMVAIRQTWKEIHQKCQAYENGDLAGRQLPVTREKERKGEHTHWKISALAGNKNYHVSD